MPMPRAVILAMLALTPLACTSPSGPSMTQRGLDEQQFNDRIAAVEWQARQSEQQPGTNPNYPNQKRSVFPQPVEDPLNTGRDLER